MFLGISFACKIIYLSFYFRFLYNEKLDEGGGTIDLGYPPFPVIKMDYLQTNIWPTSEPPKEANF